LVFAALAFAVLIRMKIYPAEIRAVNLDFDWTYRKVFPSIIRGTSQLFTAMFAPAKEIVAAKMKELRDAAIDWLTDSSQQKSVESGYAAIWAALLLASFMILYMI